MFFVVKVRLISKNVRESTTFGKFKAKSDVCSPIKVQIVSLVHKGSLLDHVILKDAENVHIHGLVSNKNLAYLLILVKERLPLYITILRGQWQKDSITIFQAIIDPNFPVSASLFNKYRHCPRLVYLDDFICTFKRFEYPLARGNLIHELFAQLYMNLTPDSVSSKENLAAVVEKVVSQVLKSQWYTLAVIGLSEADTDKKIIQSSRLIDELWYNKEFISKAKFLCEMRVQSSQYGLKGVIDRIEEVEDGIIVTEIKTGKKYPDKLESAKLQAAVYALIIQETSSQVVKALKIDLPDLPVSERFTMVEFDPDETLNRVIPTRNDIYYYLTGGNGEKCDIAPFMKCKPFCFGRESCEFFCRITRILEDDEKSCEACEHRLNPGNYDPCIFPSLLSKKNIQLPYDYYKWFQIQLDSLKIATIKLQGLLYEDSQKLEQLGISIFDMGLIEEKAFNGGYRVIFKRLSSDNPIIPSLQFFPGERVLITPKTQIPLSEYSVFGLIASCDFQTITIFRYEPFVEKIQKIAFVESQNTQVFRIDSFPLENISRQKQIQDLFLHSNYLTKSDQLVLYQNVVKLREILFFTSIPHFRTIKRQLASDHLNSCQKKAIIRTLEADDFHLIYGLPGSGKTTVICEIAKEFVDSIHGLPGKSESQVYFSVPLLITTPTSMTADILIRRLHLYFPQVGSLLRLGPLSNIQEDEIKQHTLEYLTLSAMDRSLRAQELIHSAKIIICTNTAATSSLLNYIRFDIVIIDEARSCSEPSSLLPLIKANRFILVGDMLQLPNVVIKKKDFTFSPLDSTFHTQLLIHDDDTIELSLFERLMRKYSGNDSITTFLNVQYRMHPQIANYFAQHYRLAFQTADSIKKRVLNDFYVHCDIGNSVRGIAYRIFDSEFPLIFVDTAGKRWQLDNETSCNPSEAQFVAQVLFDYLSGLRPRNFDRLKLLVSQIGVTSPYRLQIGAIKQCLTALVARTENHLYKALIDVLTINLIEWFQGTEHEIMILSLCGLAEYRQDMVDFAISRGRSKVIIVGDSTNYASQPAFKQLYDYVSSINGIVLLD